MADTTPPSVSSVTDDLAGVANRNTGTIRYLFTFSEAVSGLDVADFSASNGTVTGVTLVGGGSAGTQWSVGVTPATNASGNIALTLKAAAVSDAAGNPNASFVTAAQALDTLAPVAPKLVTTRTIDTLINPQVTVTLLIPYNGQYYYAPFVVELFPDQAPVTVANFLAYVEDDFYYATVFHRVIANFMVQAGGMVKDSNGNLLGKTPTYAPIVLESNNGLSNLRGTLAMARTNVADSATSQFYVNVVDNGFLDYTGTASLGYAVFGEVVVGLNVLDYVASLATTTLGGYADVPVNTVYIADALPSQAGLAVAQNATFKLSDLEPGATWQYSLDAGAHWLTGSGTELNVPLGVYAPNAIQVRQTDANGNTSEFPNLFGSTLAVQTSLEQPSRREALSVNPATLTVAAGQVAKLTDVAGAQTFVLEKGAKLDLDAALGRNVVVLQGVALSEVAVFRQGQEAKVVALQTAEVLLSVPIAVTEQVLRFDTQNTLLGFVNGLPQWNGQAVPVERVGTVPSGATLFNVSPWLSGTVQVHGVVSTSTKLALDDKVFARFLGDDMVADNFWVKDGPGALAQDANDFLVFEAATGTLAYDTDASGPGVAQVFAKLIGTDGKPFATLGAADIVLV